jgi:hypothetical protein
VGGPLVATTGGPLVANEQQQWDLCYLAKQLLKIINVQK